MNSKVSDFRLPAAALRHACRAAGVPFVDAPLCFQAKPTEGSIHIGPSDSLSYTLYRIVERYVNEDGMFDEPLFKSDEQKRLFVMHHAISVRKLFDFPKAEDHKVQPLVASQALQHAASLGCIQGLDLPAL